MKTDGSITIKVNADSKQAQKELSKLEQKIEESERTIESTSRSLDEEKNKSLFKGAELDAEKAKLQEIRDRLREITALSKDKSLPVETRTNYAEKLPFVKEELADQKTRVQMLQTEYNKIENSVQRYDEKLKSAKVTLEDQKERAGVLEEEINSASGAGAKMGAAIDHAGSYMERFAARVKKLASRVFVFTLITSALRSMRTWLTNVIKKNDQASAAIAKLKGALLTLAQPIVNVIIPAFVMFVNILTKIVTMAANIVSTLFGTTVEQSAQAAKNLNEEQEEIEGVGGAAKKASKQLAAFDEINKLSEDGDVDAGGAGGAGAAGDLIEPDFAGMIDKKLGAIEAIVGTALLGLGALLAFSGANIPLGIALMALGALTLAAVIKENWDAIAQALRGPLGVITAIVSSAVLVLGAVLAFSGANIGLGIALMAAGALGLVGVISANWDTLTTVLQGPIGIITAILSTALLVLGAILAFSGAHIGLGIGLMALGAIGLATTVAANWDTVQKLLKGPIGIVTAIVSSALLVMGAIFTFTGSHIPLGIALMILGATGLATTVSVNWDTISKILQGKVGIITAIVSSALLVLGAILTFTGANLPLGIGLLVIGAAGLAVTIAANWNKITSALGGTIYTITAIVSAALLALGAVLLFTGANVPLGIGMLVIGGIGLAASIAPNWDYLLDKLKEAWRGIKEWWNSNVAKFFTIDYWKDTGKRIIDGFKQGLEKAWESVTRWVSGAIDTIRNAVNDVFNFVTGKKSAAESSRGDWNPAPGFGSRTRSITLPPVPALARGAVIPANREFLAVLGDQKSGTNVEAPLSTIVQAVKQALAESGGGNRTIVMEVNGREFGRVSFDLYNQESARRGVKLGVK